MKILAVFFVLNGEKKIKLKKRKKEKKKKQGRKF